MIKYYGERADLDVSENIYKNAYDFMCEYTKNYRSLIAMTYYGNEFTYEDVKDSIQSYASTLRSYGLSKGDKITIVMPNTPEIVYYKYACWILGIEAHLVDPRFNPNGIKSLVNESNSKLVVCEITTYKSKLSSIIDDLYVDKIILVSLTDSMKNKITSNVKQNIIFIYSSLVNLTLNLSEKQINSGRVILNREFVGNKMNQRINSVYDENMPAIVVYTSGTTGTPKGAILTHEAYNSKTKQISYGVPDLLPGDHFLAAIPFFSAYGSFAGMHNVMCKGMNMFMIPKFSSNEFAKLICQYRINTAIGVPDHWDQFEKNADKNVKKYKLQDYSFLKNPVSGGDVISPKIIDRCNDTFKKYNSEAKIIVGYGGSEGGGPEMTTVKNDAFYDNEYTGIMFPGLDYIYLDPDTKEVLEDATSGELAIYDPSMMLGYINNPEETKKVFIEHNGKKYYITGDLFANNDRGMFYFKGRVKRAIMRPDGHTVHALPIEEVLNLSNLVDKCCVVGISRGKDLTGSIPTAFVVLKDNVTSFSEVAKKLDEHCLVHLPERNRALAYVFLNNLPYTLMGKVDYKKLEKISIDELDMIYVDDTLKPRNKVLFKK